VISTFKMTFSKSESRASFSFYLRSQYHSQTQCSSLALSTVPTRIWMRLRACNYGPGSLKTALPKLLDILGTKKVLIVTGKSLNNNVSSLRLVVHSKSVFYLQFLDGCREKSGERSERARCLRCYVLRDWRTMAFKRSETHQARM
jgi:hypothetical protein